MKIKKIISLVMCLCMLVTLFANSFTTSALSMGFTLGCYNSTEGSNLVTGTDTANKYVATRIFTRDELPNGTEIRIDQGYKYRPEGWVSLDQKNSSRPSQVYGYSTVIVDDEWWGDYNYRSFNISKSNEVDISSSYLDVASHFTITLPEEIEEETIRILAIGNSFSNDAFHYAEEIAAKFGIKTEFWSLYQSGCYISKHLDNFNNKTAAYTIYRNGVQVRGSVTMNQILDECNFDYITLQQGSARSNKWSYYYSEENPYIVDLYNAIKAEQPNAEFLIHQTWGYSPAEAIANGHTGSLDHFTAIESCYNKAAELLDLPLAKSGKAIQLVKDYGFLTDDRGGVNSVYADEYCHLTNRGDFIAGCVLVETIFGVDVTSKDFTSLFVDAENLCKVAHSAVTGEPIAEEEEEYIPEPKRTMLQYKRTSNGYYKCIYKLPTTLEANTEYTITLAVKHVTSTTNMLFGLYGIDSSTGVGNPTNDALNETTALLRSSDGSGVAKFGAATNNSYGRYLTYTFTLTEEEAANKTFYLGYSFNRSEGVEFYISEFALYKSGDETKKSLLNVNDYSTDATNWCTPYGQQNSAAKYVEYNPSYFKTALHVNMTTAASARNVGIRIPASNIVKGKTYTISFDYYFMNRGLDYGVYPLLLGTGNTSTTNGNIALTGLYNLRSTSRSGMSGSAYKNLTTVKGDYQSQFGKANYTFTIPTTDANKYTYYYLGFYLKKDSSWTSSPSFYISNFNLTVEGSDTNILTANEYTTSLSVGNYAWRDTNGYLGNNNGFKCSYVPAYTGDANMDGELDIRDLVKTDDDVTKAYYNLFADTNVDNAFDEYDIKNIRYQLLGLGIIIPKPMPKPEEPDDAPPFDVIPTGDVTAVKTASKTTAQTVLPGEKVSYTVELTNNELTDEAVVLYEKLPEGAELAGGDCEVKNGYIAWEGNIDALGSETVTYTLKIKDDKTLCGTILSGDTMSVNNNFTEGYDLYIENTASSKEDQRYLSNAIRALKDSTYRDKLFSTWVYYVAFTKNIQPYFPDSIEDTLTKITNGTASADTLKMIAPTLYGGNSISGQIEGVKGAPCSAVTTNDLIVGDLLYIKSGNTIKDYIFDKDGLVDMSAPMTEVDTNAVLNSLTSSDIFVVLRPSINISRDYIIDDELEELTLTEQQKAVIATAESYVLRGEKLQYSDTRFGGISNTEYRWNTGDRNPEFTNRDEWGYINCAGFTYEAYNTALGVNLAYGSTRLWSTTRLSDYASNAGIQAYRYTRTTTTVEDEATRKQIKNEVLTTIEPGDLMVVIRSGTNSGHVVLYIGNGTFIHSTGSVYKVDDGEYYEPTIRYNRVEDYFFTEGSGGYIFNDSTKSTDSQVTKFVVVRPLKSDTYNVTVPQETVNRMNNMQGIMAQKLSSHNSTTTANRGEEVTFSFELYNTNDTAKTVEVRDTIPANTTYVSGADNVNGENLSWSVNIPANTRVTVSYIVRVNDNAAYGDYIQTTDTSTVGGVRTICPKVYINRTLTSEEQNKVVEAFNTLKANGTTKTGLALVNEIYKTAGIADVVFDSTDYATVMEGAEGTFKVVAQDSGNDYYQLTDKGTKYRDMMVETLYGGRRYYGFSGDARTDRTRLAREHHIMVGDVIIRRISSGTYYAYLHIGGDHFINITSGITTETTTAKKRLELLLSAGRYYAVYRPSFSIK